MNKASKSSDKLHLKQLEVWEEEHKHPFNLPWMDEQEPSSGVVMFWDWYKGKIKGDKVRGIEMCCGKGRNSLYLASLGIEMVGYDFSKIAINEAKARSNIHKIENNFFIVHDALKKLPFKNNHFDFAIDCFGSTDIDSKEGREKMRDEIIRVLKDGGLYFVYLLSTDDAYHKRMLKKYKIKNDKNAFIHPRGGKFEKVYDKAELLDFFKELKLLESRRVNKKATFEGKEYDCSHFWMIFQKHN